MKAAVGSLIAVAYKGNPGVQELKRKSWPDAHKYLKEQEWYQFYSGDDGYRGGFRSDVSRP